MFLPFEALQSGLPLQNQPILRLSIGSAGEWIHGLFRFDQLWTSAPFALSALPGAWLEATMGSDYLAPPRSCADLGAFCEESTTVVEPKLAQRLRRLPPNGCQQAPRDYAHS